MISTWIDIRVEYISSDFVEYWERRIAGYLHPLEVSSPNISAGQRLPLTKSAGYRETGNTLKTRTDKGKGGWYTSEPGLI